MKIQARAVNKQVLEIQGISRGIYLRFPNVAKTFFMKLLVVQNLSCNLNLGAQFNFKTGLVPQRVIHGEDGQKTNFSELDGIWIRLQFQDVSNETLQKTVGDPEFLQWLKKELLQQCCVVDQVRPHTLHLSKMVQQEKQGRKG